VTVDTFALGESQFVYKCNVAYGITVTMTLWVIVYGEPFILPYGGVPPIVDAPPWGVEQWVLQYSHYVSPNVSCNSGWLGELPTKELRWVDRPWADKEDVGCREADVECNVTDTSIRGEYVAEYHCKVIFGIKVARNLTITVYGLPFIALSNGVPPFRTGPGKERGCTTARCLTWYKWGCEDPYLDAGGVQCGFPCSDPEYNMPNGFCITEWLGYSGSGWGDTGTYRWGYCEDHCNTPQSEAIQWIERGANSTWIQPDAICEAGFIGQVQNVELLKIGDNGTYPSHAVNPPPATFHGTVDTTVLGEQWFQYRCEVPNGVVVTRDLLVVVYTPPVVHLYSGLPAFTMGIDSGGMGSRGGRRIINTGGLAFRPEIEQLLLLGERWEPPSMLCESELLGPYDMARAHFADEQQGKKLHGPVTSRHRE
jgi:hypothetical protein